MYAILSCIGGTHDYRLVLLAALICIAVSAAAVLLLRHARDRRDMTGTRWLLFAGVSTGFGIWCTHFVAMLGYDTGVAVGYDLALTMVSLAIATVAVTLGFLLSFRDNWLRRMVGATLVGLGIVAMHYIGMSAVIFPGEFLWSRGYIVASVIFAVAPMVFAIHVALTGRTRASAIAATSLIAAAILLAHFTGMTALTVIPSNAEPSASALLSPVARGLAIAAAAVAILSSLAVTALVGSRTHAMIEESARQFKVLVQGVKDCAICMLDPEGRVSTWNPGVEQLTGYAREEIIGHPLDVFYTPEDRDAGVPALLLKRAKQEGSHRAEGWRCRKDGSTFWAHEVVEILKDELGKEIGFAKITRDMTRFKEDQERLSELTRNLDAALSHMHQGLIMFDADERIVLANYQVAPRFGISPSLISVGTKFADFIRVALEKRLGGQIANHTIEEVLARHRACRAQPDGGTLIVPYIDDRTILVAHRPMPGGGWVSTFEDITDRRRAEERIEHMALHDGLTGLANRAHYNDRLEEALKTAARDGLQVAVVGIDLNRFKEINDNYGHAAGDQLLVQLSQRLNETSRPGDVYSRFGGDEFAAFRTFSSDDELTDFIGRLESALSTPVALGDLMLVPSASIGVSIFPRDGETRENIVNNADLAMYRAKGALGRATCFFEQGMDEAARTRRQLAADLRGAANRGELWLAYQVQRSLTDHSIVGYEALLRWNHPTLGPIPPNDFIPVAEESGAILEIGEWVLQTACAEAAEWPKPWRVAVNLSPIQLMHVDLAELVAHTLLTTHLSPHRLELEITESALIEDKLRALHSLRRVKALGVSIAIDDFGKGYSSLDTLHSFPFDKIKIDRSFLLESGKSPQARAIIRAIVALGKGLDLPVLAEGLESEDQLELLRREGCTEAQGFFFGRPGAIAHGVPPASTGAEPSLTLERQLLRA